MRTLALAEEALSRGWKVVLAGEITEPALSRARSHDGLILDSAWVPPFEVRGFDVVHLDCYDETLDRIASDAALLSSMADGQFGLRPADLTIDPSPWALRRREEMQAASGGQLLLGPRYASLRRQVTAHRSRLRTSRSDPVPPRVLVVMGGTDPLGLTGPVVELLAGLPVTVDVTAVCSPGAASAVRRAWAGAPGRVTVVDHLDDLARAAISHSLVISAAGTSAWELACVGVPTALVCAVDNQKENFEALVNAGAAIGLDLESAAGDATYELTEVLRNHELLSELGAGGQRLVDGRGAWRIVSAWESLLRVTPSTRASGDDLVARSANMRDAAALLDWRNDTTTRLNSRTHEEVSREDHVRWLSGAIASPNRHLLLLEEQGEPVGTVRWDREEGDFWEQVWEVSITVAPRHRGRGLAVGMLLAAEKWLREESTGDAIRLIAAIHESNLASRRTFARAGYLPDQPADAEGFMCLARSVTSRSGPT